MGAANITETILLEDACAEIIDNLRSNPVYSETGTVPTLRSPDVGWGKLFLDTALKTDEAEYIDELHVVNRTPATSFLCAKVAARAKQQ